MKKKIIDRLIEKQGDVRKLWSKQELKDLQELKDAGVTPVTIINDSETMLEHFPYRSKTAVRGQYERL